MLKGTMSRDAEGAAALKAVVDSRELYCNICRIYVWRPAGMTDLPPISTWTFFVLAGIAVAMPQTGSIAGEREDAAAFLKLSLECPAIPTETKKEKNGWFEVRKTSNRYLGDHDRFKMRESYTMNFGVVGGESYETDNFIEVSFALSDVESVSTSGTKATVRCKESGRCMQLLYVSNPDEELASVRMREDPNDCFEEGMCREEASKRKSSYRISTCSPETAADVKEAVEFLAGN